MRYTALCSTAFCLWLSAPATAGSAPPSWRSKLHEFIVEPQRASATTHTARPEARRVVRAGTQLRFYLGNEPLVFEDRPILRNNRAYVPVRELIDALNRRFGLSLTVHYEPGRGGGNVYIYQEDAASAELAAAPPSTESESLLLTAAAGALARSDVRAARALVDRAVDEIGSPDARQLAEWLGGLPPDVGALRLAPSLITRVRELWIDGVLCQDVRSLIFLDEGEHNVCAFGHHSPLFARVLVRAGEVRLVAGAEMVWGDAGMSAPLLTVNVLAGNGVPVPIDYCRVVVPVGHALELSLDPADHVVAIEHGTVALVGQQPRSVPEVALPRVGFAPFESPGAYLFRLVSVTRNGRGATPVDTVIMVTALPANSGAGPMHESGQS